MFMQMSIVAVLVTACAVYAAWTLMPAAGRKALAGALGVLPAPVWLKRRLGAVASAGAGCGCDGCDRAPKNAGTVTAPAAVQPLTFHPRVRR